MSYGAELIDSLFAGVQPPVICLLPATFGEIHQLCRLLPEHPDRRLTRLAAVCRRGRRDPTSASAGFIANCAIPGIDGLKPIDDVVRAPPHRPSINQGSRILLPPTPQRHS